MLLAASSLKQDTTRGCRQKSDGVQDNRETTLIKIICWVSTCMRTDIFKVCVSVIANGFEK